MKKFITAVLTILCLITSAISMASVNTDDNDIAYLFGQQEVIEMQNMSNAEMQATQGQLFGITLESLANVLAPIKTSISRGLHYARAYITLMVLSPFISDTW